MADGLRPNPQSFPQVDAGVAKVARLLKVMLGLEEFERRAVFFE